MLDLIEARALLGQTPDFKRGASGDEIKIATMVSA